jgi:hypothetical protein
MAVWWPARSRFVPGKGRHCGTGRPGDTQQQQHCGRWASKGQHCAKGQRDGQLEHHRAGRASMRERGAVASRGKRGAAQDGQLEHHRGKHARASKQARKGGRQARRRPCKGHHCTHAHRVEDHLEHRPRPQRRPDRIRDRLRRRDVPKLRLLPLLPLRVGVQHHHPRSPRHLALNPLKNDRLAAITAG